MTKIRGAIRHLSALHTLLLGKNEIGRRWNVLKYPRTSSLLYSIFCEANLETILLSGYNFQMEFLVELLRRHFNNKTRKTASQIKFGWTHSPKCAFNLVAELAKTVAEIDIEFGRSIESLNRNAWKYLKSNQVVRSKHLTRSRRLII